MADKSLIENERFTYLLICALIQLFIHFFKKVWSSCPVQALWWVLGMQLCLRQGQYPPGGPDPGRGGGGKGVEEVVPSVKHPVTH